jgi:hypothetical protein
LLILLLFIHQSDTTSCNSFPKIFGGSYGSTYLNQIDVYNDYLAFAGFTYDSSLTGFSISSDIPYIALSSIASSGKYYWAKAFSLVTYVEIASV